MCEVAYMSAMGRMWRHNWRLDFSIVSSQFRLSDSNRYEVYSIVTGDLRVLWDS
jgi:hypothetical protein